MEAMELEVKKQLDAERERIRKEAADQAAESNRLNMAQRDKTIQDLQGKIADLKQRAEQGSMQLQGEILELDLEDRIAAAFPYDSVKPNRSQIDCFHIYCTSLWLMFQLSLVSGTYEEWAIGLCDFRADSSSDSSSHLSVVFQNPTQPIPGI